MSLLTCLLAVLSAVTIASPVPDAEVGFSPSPSLNGIPDFDFGSYLPPPPPQNENVGGNIIASQDALVFGDSEDLLTTAFGGGNSYLAAPIAQSDTLEQPILDSNGILLAQTHFEDEKSSSSKSDTTTPFQKYLNAECGGTKSVCCSGIRINTSNNEQPGVPLPCSESMQYSYLFFLLFFHPPSTSNKRLILHKENTKMIDAGYERFLWPNDGRTGRYCLEPVYLTDCNTVYVSFLFLYPPPSLFANRSLSSS